MANQQFGGSFAPPLTEDLISKYTSLANSADPKVGDGMKVLLTLVKKWWELPESSMTGAVIHSSGVGIANPLDSPIASELDPLIPWEDELNLMGQRFDSIPADSQADIRNAAYHLLWFARELYLGREPITGEWKNGKWEFTNKATL